MSDLVVTTIATANGTTDLVLKTGNTTGAQVTIGANGTVDYGSNNFSFTVGSDAQGDIYYRNASGILARLPAGTSGQVLQTQGAGANPQWAASSGGMVSLATASASSDASIDFTGLSSSYAVYRLIGRNILPATDSTNLWLRTSTDGGSTYDSGASDYLWAYWYAAAVTDAADTEVQVAQGVGNAAGEGVRFLDMIIYRPASVEETYIQWQLFRRNATGGLYVTYGTGCRNAAQDVDAFQILFSSGNVASGEFELFGVGS